MDRVKQMKDARTTGGKPFRSKMKALMDGADLRAIGGMYKDDLLAAGRLPYKAGHAAGSAIKRATLNSLLTSRLGGKRTAKVGQAAANRSTPSQSKMSKAVRASGRTQKKPFAPRITARKAKQPRNPYRGGSR